MTIFFSDTFAGSGSLSNHTPETGFAGNWATNTSPNSAGLSGGFLVFPAGASVTAIGSYGDTDEVADYGAPLNAVFSFTMTTPAVLPSSGSVGLRLGVTTGGIGYSLELEQRPDLGNAWGLRIASYHTNASFINVSASLAANATYAGTLAVSGGVCTLSFLGQTLTVTDAATSAVGVNYLFVEIGPGFSLGSLEGDAAALTVTDPNFANVSLLLHGDGADNSTAIVDSSGNPKIVTRHGNPVIKAAVGAYGGSYIQLGSPNFLTVPNSSDFDLSSGAWTVEARLYPLSLSGAGSFLSIRSSNFGFTFAYYQGQAFAYSSNSGNQQPSAPLNLNQYNHVEYSHDGTTFRMFVNGELKYSTTSFSIPWNSGLPVIIGASELNGQEALEGYIEELRVTKGLARHTASFTPPTRAYPDSSSSATLTCPMQTISASASSPYAAATLTCPMQTVSASGLPSDGLFCPVGATSAFGGGYAALGGPMQAALGYGGGYAQLTPASPMLTSIGAGVGYGNLAPRIGEASGFGGATAAVTGAFPALFANGHDSSGENAFAGAAPPASLVFMGGANAQLAAASPVLALTGTFWGFGAIALAAPAPALAAAGTVSAVADAALSTPMASLVGYSGAVCSITLTGQATVQASGTTGSVGQAALTCPLFELSASGSAQNRGSAGLLAPAAQLGATAQAWIMAPMATLTAIGTTRPTAST